MEERVLKSNRSAMYLLARFWPGIIRFPSVKSVLREENRRERAGADTAMEERVLKSNRSAMYLLARLQRTRSARRLPL